MCECFNIYIDDIKKAVEQGASTFEDLEKSMKLGVLCSACVKDSKNIIEQLNSERKESLPK